MEEETMAMEKQQEKNHEKLVLSKNNNELIYTSKRK